MLDAAEDVAGLRDAALGLKWPNDIVADGADGRLRKVAGVLGEAALDDDRVETRGHRYRRQRRLGRRPTSRRSSPAR